MILIAERLKKEQTFSEILWIKDMKIKDDVSVDALMYILNEIIKNAIDHGGDPGGPYGCNDEGLRKFMRAFLDKLELNDEWTIEEYNINCALYMMFKRRT